MLIKRIKSLSPFQELNVSLSVKTWVPFTQRCFVPSLDEIGLVVLESGEDFYILSMYFVISLLSSFGIGHAPSFKQT